jgi:hypothetical protein
MRPCLLQFTPGPLPLNYLDLPTKAPDGPHCRVLLPMLKHVIQYPQHAASAAVEGNLSQR